MGAFPLKRAHGQMSESHADGGVHRFSGRRPAGRLYLSLPRQGVCQRADGQHRPVRREYCRGQLGWRSRIFPADSGVRTGRCGGGGDLSKWRYKKRQSDINIHWRQICRAGRDRAADCSGIPAAEHEHHGQHHDLVHLRDAGRVVPQGARQRIWQPRRVQATCVRAPSSL